MADAYHPYVSEELPLTNHPTNKRSNMEGVASGSFAATRPTTEAAANESLLGLGDPAMASGFFDDVVGFSMGSSLGELIDDSGINNNTKTVEVYDDEYGGGQAPRASMEHISSSKLTNTLAEYDDPPSDDFIVAEKIGSTSRGELIPDPPIITPSVGKWGERDSFADADLGIEGGGDEDVVSISSEENGGADSQTGGGPKQQQQVGDGLNNLMTLQSRRKLVNWRASSSDMEYQSEMEFFVEDTDDGEGAVGDDDDRVDPIERSVRAGKRLELMEEMMMTVSPSGNSNNNSTNLKDKLNQSTSSILSNSNNTDDPLMPVDIASVKDMKKEEYWDLFNKILSMPTDGLVPEEDHQMIQDPVEFLKQQEEAKKQQRAAQAKEAKEQAKWERLRQRERKRRSLNRNTPERSRSTDVFEPPKNLLRPQVIASRARSVDTEVFEPPPGMTKSYSMKLPRVRQTPPTNTVGPPRCRSIDTEIFEPPSSSMTKKQQQQVQKEQSRALRRSSSFGGVTVKERQNHHHYHFFSKSKKLHTTFRLKKPEFVSTFPKVMASFSVSKLFHHHHPNNKIEHPRSYDG